MPDIIFFVLARHVNIILEHWEVLSFLMMPGLKYIQDITLPLCKHTNKIFVQTVARHIIMFYHTVTNCTTTNLKLQPQL